MSCCARCGQGICSTAGKIALNKAWHKSCFCCYNCNRPLNVNTAKIYYGEVFCACCRPQVPEICPLKVCRVNSTPSFNPDCCQRALKPIKCISSDSDDCCRPRDVHSCSCIPACCRECGGEEPPPPCPPPPKRPVPCRPRSPKPCDYPPRRRRPCPCARCCRRRACREEGAGAACRPPPPTRGCRCCCGGGAERCTRCGEKVFAAEKVLTANGAYHVGCFSCCCCCKSLCVKTMYEACGEIYCRQCYNNYFGVSLYGYTCC